jgi:hypothetical protein
MACVLRGFLSATYFKCAANKKTLCGLAHRKNCSFRNRKYSPIKNQKKYSKKGFLQSSKLDLLKAFFVFQLI